MGGRFSMNSYLGQRILSFVREGDYAHAGEEEAIELALSGVEKNTRRLILDAGCGRGGTADYLNRNGWGRVIGIDIEPESIDAARERYPGASFIVCDVCGVDRHVTERPEIVCMFNAYYCFEDQSGALGALLKIARPDARMIIFDHVDRGGYQDDPLMDAGEPFLPNPLRLSEVRERMSSTGWQVLDIQEVHDAYIGWYASLMSRIERARDRITDMAGHRGYEHVHGLYQGLLNAAQQKRLGAAIITAAPVS
ncbi:hypothetical protein MesoLjLc_76680 [Mesorhizobium sp. L-8-10]|uniref:class I SAM-dependent methyltransferase n=1 Tax=Mesorhizobium sp. L-8-10 TaxID=2744523 RepID=UPI0019295557|nr:class I SAM-dependent methyltransferase [Mesorhizobium sp. L-8-10]BCH35738.1 hypothetical protein MesoLjLc_76680 [Mesorhizobium sp. L-8-10]